MKRWRRWLLLGLPTMVAAAAGAAILAAPDPSYRLASWMALGRYHAHDNTIRRIAQHSGLDPLLLKAIAWQASAFDAKKATGTRRGLLQINETQAREWAAAERIETFMFTDLFDADTNLRAGAWTLQRALKDGAEFDHPEQYALVVFKAGRLQARAWSNGTTSASELLAHADPDTRAFVAAVESRRSFYRSNGW